MLILHWKNNLTKIINEPLVSKLVQLSNVFIRKMPTAAENPCYGCNIRYPNLGQGVRT